MGVIAGALFLLGWGIPVLAQDGVVAVGGETLFVIKAEAGGKSVRDRADAVTDRLPDILGDSTIDALDIRLVPGKGKDYNIMVKSRLLVTVTPEDGVPNKRSAMQQAQVWLNQLRKVLPQVTAQPNANIIRAAPQSVTGTVSYLQRIALPPNATLVVKLLDVSKMDVAATVVAKKVYTNIGQVPVKFSLPYTLAQIAGSSTYAVDAEIRYGGKTRWRPKQQYRVITNGSPDIVEIIMTQVK